MQNIEKISVIICVNDERKFAECALYLEQQELPAKYALEIVAIEGAESIFAGYEYGRQQKHTHYMIYMHQDVYLTNKKCIAEMIELFEENPEIGMQGLVGSVDLPVNGIWWEANKDSRYGSVVQGGAVPEYIEQIDGAPISKPYQEVKVIDGLFMMTRANIPWRNDLFNSWHFYDISQSMEYIKQGYKIVVPYAESPWAFHDAGRVYIEHDDSYEKSRKIFLREYRI